MLTSLVYPLIAASWIIGLWSLCSAAQSAKRIDISHEQNTPVVLKDLS